MDRGTSQGIGVKNAARYFRAAHGMDRVHSRWTAWDVRRTRPAARDSHFRASCLGCPLADPFAQPWPAMTLASVKHCWPDSQGRRARGAVKCPRK
jgi:hypothetical protein